MPKSALPPIRSPGISQISASEHTVHRDILQDPVSCHLHSVGRVVVPGMALLCEPQTKGVGVQL